MKKYHQNKLWRDKAPELMEQMGSIIYVQMLEDVVYDKELRNKLVEEVHEVVVAKDRQEIVGECADILEVLDAIYALHAISKEEVEAIQTKKRVERGGFFKRQYVSIAEHPTGSFGEKYCLANPDKYPEVDVME